jgi:hypothetical protein
MIGILAANGKSDAGRLANCSWREAWRYAIAKPVQ